MVLRTPRLPRRFTVWLHLALGAMVLIYGAMAWSSTGLFAVGAWLVLGAFVASWAAVTWATRPARGDVAPGERVVTGSRPLAALLLAAWALVLIGTVVWVVEAVRTGGDVQQPGFVVVMALGSLLSLPDLVRLLMGRIRLWRLEAGADAVRYEGGRRRVEVPWSDVESIGLNPIGARLQVTRRSGEPGVDASVLGFDVPPEQLVRLLEEARPKR